MKEAESVLNQLQASAEAPVVQSSEEASLVVKRIKAERPGLYR
jgi:hypothetical protein